MGYRSLIRAVAADYRRGQREQQRLHRQRVRTQIQQQKQFSKLQVQLQKEEIIQMARGEVEAHESHLAWILTPYKSCSETFNWQAIRHMPPPPEPLPTTENQDAAENVLRAYKPTLMEKLSGKDKKKREELNALVIQGYEKDKEAYQAALSEHNRKIEEWKLLCQIADGIISCSPASYLTALKELDLFTDMEEIGQAVQFTVDENNAAYLETNLYLHPEDIVPSESKTFLKTGKVSTKKLPPTKFNEIYQDHVASAMLRTAREVYAILPAVNYSLINGWAALLNTQTGNRDWMPIISAWFVRGTLSGLNFERLDPSDSLKNFSHSVDFNKNTGFKMIQPLQMEQFGVTRGNMLFGDLITIEQDPDTAAQTTETKKGITLTVQVLKDGQVTDQKKLTIPSPKG
jgi:hypothetical protein